MTDRILTEIEHSIGPAFDRLLAKSDFEGANKAAMSSVAAILETGLETGRRFLWRRFFGRLLGQDVAHYQCSDFEIVDYELGAVSGARALYRGPLPTAEALENGEYVCLIGAAQFFGRFHTECLHTMIAGHFGLPVLNLSIGGIGPQEFLKAPFPELAARARVVLVQFLSGRSVGCEEYPGGWTTFLPGKTDPVPRETVLRRIWQQDRDEAMRLIGKWNTNYVDHYDRLAEICGGAAILVWMSDREPDDWNEAAAYERAEFGLFPQLVSAATLDRISSRYRSTVICPVLRGQPFGFRSRFTAEPCPCLWPPDGTPVWKTDYYPSAEANSAAFAALSPAIEEALS